MAATALSTTMSHLDDLQASEDVAESEQSVISLLVELFSQQPRGLPEPIIADEKSECFVLGCLIVNIF